MCKTEKVAICKPDLQKRGFEFDEYHDCMSALNFELGVEMPCQRTICVRQLFRYTLLLLRSDNINAISVCIL